jgi:AcrR family transcriptional regulator
MAADPSAPATPRRRRRRDPEASRAAILDAAREVFTERGYARGTIREIARRAGVTHGLVMRHFPTKEQLLLAALPGPRELEQIAGGDPATLPERIAATYVDLMEDDDADHAFVALIRSAASGVDVAVPLLLALEDRAIRAYAGVLQGDDVDVLVELMGAQLIGVTFSRYILRTGRLADLSRDELVTYLSAVLRRLLAPALPPSG